MSHIAPDDHDTFLVLFSSVFSAWHTVQCGAAWWAEKVPV